MIIFLTIYLLILDRSIKRMWEKGEKLNISKRKLDKIRINAKMEMKHLRRIVGRTLSLYKEAYIISTKWKLSLYK